MRLASWLHACQFETAAMASTGVSWGPVYEMLEARGLHVHLVKARHLKHGPLRKSDVEDCRKRSRGQHKEELPARGYVA